MASIVVETNVPIPMRDGARLYADIYRPSPSGRYPVLLQRTPYDKSAGRAQFLDAIRAAEQGYAVVIQDTRGRYSSDGEFAPFVSDIEDGYDTVEWCAGETWSNGRVGMYGISYVGATQWLAAIAAPPHLCAIAPGMTAADYYNGWVYRGGALNLAFVAGWTAQFLAVPHLKRLGLTPEQRRDEEAAIMRSLDHLRRTLSHLPLSELPLLRRENLAPYFHEWLAHPDGDDYWERSSIAAHHSRICVPALNIGGWYDLFPAGPLDNFAGISKLGATDTARAGQKLIVGPWVHAFPPPAITGQRNFGWDSVLNWGELQYRWFDHWLKDIDNGVERERAVRIFVMNRGWRVEDEWPLARTRYTPFFLRSGGRANTLNGDGVLSIDPPSGEPPDTFSYDPMDPVPTVGAQGIHDHRRVETRADVLIYSTPPLEEEIEVTGPVKLILFAATSAPDTDFTARLIDVAPGGYAANLCEGIVRARYRDTARCSTLMEPGGPYRFTIDLVATSNLFQRGHRIRLEVSSSNFPRYDRNLNTGGPVAESSEPRIARQTVFHDNDLASHLLLPIITQI
jgi:putative CocE/NonD family hydrolase